MPNYVATLSILAIGVGLAMSCKRRATTYSQSTGAVKATSVHLPTGLRDGDLIFQESTSGQSEMVRALTSSRWTHMGVVWRKGASTEVLEASSPVRITPLERWIAHGRGGRYVVKRVREAETKLSPDVVGKMHALGTNWLGHPYDLRFRWDDQTLYCSELAYKLFERAAGIRLGKLQRASEMNLEDPRVQQAIRKRFANAKFDPDEPVVTPDSIFNDEQLVEVTP